MDRSTQWNDLLDSLIDARVLVEVDGEGLELSDEFDRRRRELRNQDLDASSVMPDIDDGRSLVRPNSSLVADVVAIREFDPDLEIRSALLAARAINSPDIGDPTHGSPDGFVPIRGDEIEAFLNQYPETIVYFWRDDCEPCDRVKDYLSQLLENGEIPNEIGTAAVYGPNYAEELKEAYDVAAAPTILFFTNGAVDTRLFGVYPPEAIRKEIDVIADSA